MRPPQKPTPSVEIAGARGALQLWRDYFARCQRIQAENEAAQSRWWALASAANRGGEWPGTAPKPKLYPPFPVELRGLRCGAKTRKGLPCMRTDLMRNGRCKFHGGMSTGPKTAVGRQRSQGNLALGRGKRKGTP